MFKIPTDGDCIVQGWPGVKASVEPRLGLYNSSRLAFLGASSYSRNQGSFREISLYIVPFMTVIYLRGLWNLPDGEREYRTGRRMKGVLGFGRRHFIKEEF